MHARRLTSRGGSGERTAHTADPNMVTFAQLFALRVAHMMAGDSQACAPNQTDASDGNPVGH
jgi:hypothetical protein